MLNITKHQGNANQNHNEKSPHPLFGWELSKTQEITNAVEDVEKKESLYTVGMNVNWYSIMEK